MSSTAFLTTWPVDEASAAQDAGYRSETSSENEPTNGDRPFFDRRVLRGTRELGLPHATQGARAALAGIAADPGDARVEAVSTVRARGIADVPRLRPAPAVKTGQFRALQEWEGTVIDRREDAIRVRLVDKTRRQEPEEEAEIPLEELSPADLPLVQAGAVFYWSVGYRDSPAGQRTRQSSITFRRLPRWTKRELDDLKEEARRRAARFGWH